MYNNAVPADKIGKVNGFAQSAAALSRSVSPALSGFLWSWSTRQTFEGSVFIAYYLAFIFYILAATFSFCVNPSVDHPFSENSIVRY